MKFFRSKNRNFSPIPQYQKKKKKLRENCVIYKFESKFDAGPIDDSKKEEGVQFWSHDFSCMSIQVSLRTIIH